MKRYGMVTTVKAEKLEEYKQLHANPWPGVLATLSACNIHNYSIFYRDGYLFSYFEYTGTDLSSDWAKMAADPITQEWWSKTDPCQVPVESNKNGGKWADLEEVFHLD